MSSSSPSKRLGRPPGADAEQTRNAILDAAMQSFAERGYEGTSIRDVTGDVGVGHNLVRHYFGTKQDLWRAAVQRGIGEPSREITALLDEGAASATQDVAKHAVEIMITRFAEHPDASRILTDESLRGGERFDYLYEEFLAPSGSALLRYLESGDVGLADVEPGILGLFVMTTTTMLLTQRALADRLRLTPSSPGEELDAHSRQLLHLILHGILAT